jgi:hypothetical protein
MSEQTTISPVQSDENLEDAVLLTVDETIEAAFTEDNYTPYQVIEVVNSLFSHFGVDKVLPTQMAYNYVRQGLIKADRVERMTKKDKRVAAWNVSRENAVAWATKYVSKNLPK